MLTLGKAAANTLTLMVMALELMAPALILSVVLMQLTVVGTAGKSVVQTQLRPQLVPVGTGVASVKPAGSVSVMV